MTHPAASVLQDRVQQLISSRPAELLPWKALNALDEWPARTYELRPEAIRVGAVEYDNDRIPGVLLTIPAIAATSHPVLIARPQSAASRASRLLESLAVRYALSSDRDRLRILVVDEYSDARGAMALTRLLQRFVTVASPRSVEPWLEGKEDMAALVLLYNVAHADDVSEDDAQGFTTSELSSLVHNLRPSGPSNVMIAAAFDPAAQDHPLASLFDNLSVPAARVVLRDDRGDSIVGAVRNDLEHRFEPDVCPAYDFCRRLLGQAGVL